MGQQAKKPAIRDLPKVGCELCDFRGQLMGIDTAGERYAKDCECLLVYRRAKKAMEVA
jgi:hypothetical protein